MFRVLPIIFLLTITVGNADTIVGTFFPQGPTWTGTLEMDRSGFEKEHGWMEIYEANGSIIVRAGYVKFDLSEFPPSRINSAELRYYIHDYMEGSSLVSVWKRLNIDPVPASGYEIYDDLYRNQSDITLFGYEPSREGWCNKGFDSSGTLVIEREARNSGWIAFGWMWTTDPTDLHDRFAYGYENSPLLRPRIVITYTPGIEEENSEKIYPIFSIRPNPVKNYAIITVSVNVSHLQIYDASGQLVRTLAYSNYRRFLWDGHDQQGQILPAGIYFLCLETDAHPTTRKLIKLQ